MGTQSKFVIQGHMYWDLATPPGWEVIGEILEPPSHLV